MDDVETVGPARLDDPERNGYMRMVHAHPEFDRVTIARCWNRIRQERNRQALARMQQGDSSGGLSRIEDGPRDVEWAYHYRVFPGQVPTKSEESDTFKRKRWDKRKAA